LVRNDWTTDEVLEMLESPLLGLLWRAQEVHLRYQPNNTVQLASLLSIKTGGCPEDCSYCPQSARFKVGLESEPLMELSRVLEAARDARGRGASRFCMGAAWREVQDGPDFEAVLEMVRGVRALGMEACTTLGMLTEEQAGRLAEAGLTAYNHNLDTSPEYYGSIITTRNYQDRLQTLERVRRAGITVCAGGIIGMGESLRDRARMLQVLANLDPQPEGVPINALVVVKGTALEDRPPVEPLELVRMCATARVLMPKAFVRLSAGRHLLSREAQVLCFIAGANSIFFGEKLLTTENTEMDEDMRLLRDIGAEVLPPSVDAPAASGEA
jgi:biotin synthase